MLRRSGPHRPAFPWMRGARLLRRHRRGHRRHRAARGLVRRDGHLPGHDDLSRRRAGSHHGRRGLLRGEARRGGARGHQHGGSLHLARQHRRAEPCLPPSARRGDVPSLAGTFGQSHQIGRRGARGGRRARFHPLGVVRRARVHRAYAGRLRYRVRGHRSRRSADDAPVQRHAAAAPPQARPHRRGVRPFRGDARAYRRRGAYPSVHGASPVRRFRSR